MVDPSTQHFDAIVVGAGQAGPSLAVRLARAGKRVAIVERKLVGGTCVNTGCMPTKTLIASARVAHQVARAAEYGVQVGPPGPFHLPVAMARAHAVTDKARTEEEAWLGDTEGVELIRGHARFVSGDTLDIDGRRIRATQIFLNVGGRAAIPDFPGVDDVPYLTNVSILQLETLPRHLAIVGGSYIGLEFAQMFRRFGSEVTVIEREPHLLSREDPDICDAISQMLQAEGIAIRTSADCIALKSHPEGISARLDCTDGAPEIVASHVLLATGRRPNTDDLGLDAAGVRMNDRGYIEVDDTLATNVPGIWALGDCNGRGAFTHTAYNDFEIVAANLLDGDNRSLSQRVPGYALYVDPPLGRAGLNEAQARQAGYEVLVSVRPMSLVGRAREMGETTGLMKLIADAKTRRILGAAILGIGGDESIHGLLDMMSSGRSVDDLRWAVPIHPTVSELWPTIVLGLKP
ncbi:FAD-containing oxidoreductase [Pinirhizobacter sp.]|jgi:pyruvate/2-oxoglutarate dehydrogenase complex dihydrolipoamide dehydrogenase (E3) component|uniref:FAD-containing oxidoreductase n=1 Tax=Pinirhizobacter sp. TaxID=2950432 RepID=UPI002F3F586B